MTRRITLLSVLLGVALACAAGPTPILPMRAAAPGANPASAPVSEVSTRIADLLKRRDAALPGAVLRERSALVRFYARRAGRQAWTAEAAAASLLGAVQGAHSHGLRPQDYHADALATSAPAPDAEALAERDLLLSDAFLHLARHLSTGAVNPRTLHPGYARGDASPDPVDALDAALAAGNPADALERLAPPHPEYARLRAGLARLRAEPPAPRCPDLPDGPLVQPGQRHARVALLRACLSGPAADAAPAPERLDAALAGALREFQRGHGLVPDGILGPETTAALVATPEQRIDQVRASLERWRWQPRDFGARSLRVDIANYALRAFERDEAALSMRVVVGCHGWRTPLLHSVIDALVLNPAWEVPRSIFVKEMLPRARRDPDYFARQGLELSEVRQGTRQRVDPASVDWMRVDPARTAYRVRQPPGPRNPLGRIKFLFPSPYGVYLHGTPGRAALERPVRALSHGCVRVEDELALARFALAPDPAWTPERLRAELDTALERRVALAEPLPVHLVYFTAEADSDGTLRFTADPYGWDARLLAKLGPEP